MTVTRRTELSRHRKPRDKSLTDRTTRARWPRNPMRTRERNTGRDPKTPSSTKFYEPRCCAPRSTRRGRECIAGRQVFQVYSLYRRGAVRRRMFLCVVRKTLNRRSESASWWPITSAFATSDLNRRPRPPARPYRAGASSGDGAHPIRQLQGHRAASDCGQCTADADRREPPRAGRELGADRPDDRCRRERQAPAHHRLNKVDLISERPLQNKRWKQTPTRCWPTTTHWASGR